MQLQVLTIVLQLLVYKVELRVLANRRQHSKRPKSALSMAF